MAKWLPKKNMLTHTPSAVDVHVSTHLPPLYVTIYFTSVSFKTVLWCYKNEKYIICKSWWLITMKILSITQIFSSNLVTKPSGTSTLGGCCTEERLVLNVPLQQPHTLHCICLHLWALGPQHLPHLISKVKKNYNSFMCQEKVTSLLCG